MVIDFDNVGEEGIKDVIENSSYPNRCINPEVIALESRDIGEWRDNHPLNLTGTCKTYFRSLFKPEE